MAKVEQRSITLWLLLSLFYYYCVNPHYYFAVTITIISSTLLLCHHHHHHHHHQCHPHHYCLYIVCWFLITLSCQCGCTVWPQGLIFLIECSGKWNSIIHMFTQGIWNIHQSAYNPAALIHRVYTVDPRIRYSVHPMLCYVVVHYWSLYLYSLRLLHWYLSNHMISLMYWCNAVKLKKYMYICTDSHHIIILLFVYWILCIETPPSSIDG